jgi:putative addiction module CopG family antidote
MNISLTDELQDYVTQQVETGHYKSASEVVREALRDKIRDSMREQLNHRIKIAREQVKNGQTIEATDEYFDKKIKMIEDQYINNK